MRHTDITLGQDRARRVQDLTAANTRERAKVKDALTMEARLLQSLQDSEGYQLFIRECQEEERVIYGLLEQSNDPTTLAKLTGTLLAIKSFQTFAIDRAKELLDAVAAMDRE